MRMTVVEKTLKKIVSLGKGKSNMGKNLYCDFQEKY